MRCLKRNQIPFWYALYTGKQAVVDENNYETGEQKMTYSNPVKSAANISSARGESLARQFGDNVDYDRVMVMEESPINEYSVLWVETVPQLEQDGSLSVDNSGNVVTPWDYVVKKVAPGLNSVSIAISKVHVTIPGAVSNGS